MKDFFIKNWWLFLIIIVGLALWFCGSFLPVLSPIGLLIFGVGIGIYSIVSYKKYEKDIDEEESQNNVFDARKFGYDEEIYIMGDTKTNKKKKNKFSRFVSLTPIIIFGIISVGTIILAISTFIRMFI